VWWSVAKCCSVVMFFWVFLSLCIWLCVLCTFNYVSYVFLLLCLCTLIVCTHCSVHSVFIVQTGILPTTLSEVFPCFFLSSNANARVYLAKTGHSPHSSQMNCVVLCIVCFVSFCVLFVCKCVLYYCHRVSTQFQLTNISYHIIPYIISYHIISYHISCHYQHI